MLHLKLQSNVWRRHVCFGVDYLLLILMALVFARGKTSLPKQLARMTLSRMSKFWRPFFSKTFSIQASACPQELAAAVDPQASNFVVSNVFVMLFMYGQLAK